MMTSPRLSAVYRYIQWRTLLWGSLALLVGVGLSWFAFDASDPGSARHDRTMVDFIVYAPLGSVSRCTIHSLRSADVRVGSIADVRLTQQQRLLLTQSGHQSRDFCLLPAPLSRLGESWSLRNPWHLDAKTVDRGRGGHEQCAEIALAEAKIGGVLRHADHAEAVRPCGSNTWMPPGPQQ